MSIIKEINELHINLKSNLFGVIAIIPFWYLDIFLFKPEFIENNNIYIPIVLSFCLSTCYFGLNVASGIQFNAWLYSDKNSIRTSIISFIMSVFWISILTYIGRMFSWPMMKFINVVFAFSISKVIAWGIIGFFRTKLNH